MKVLSKKNAVCLAIVATFAATVMLYTAFISFVPVTRESEILNIIQKKYAGEYDIEQVRDYSSMAMLAALDDPYSVYLNPDAYKGLMEDVSGEYSGIGVEVYIDPDDSLITVLAAFEDSPGDAAGIQPGDKIVQIDGLEVSAANYVDAINYLRGKSEESANKTEMDIVIYRPSIKERLSMKVTRSKIKMHSIKHADYGDVFYIRIAGFDTSTPAEFSKTISLINKEKVRGLVIDLRDNPGGTLRSVVQIADLLLPKGDIVYIEDRDGNRKYYKSDENNLGLPVAVLVNGNSASASEILAGAIKDNKAGVLIGEKTFGKGSVQEIIPLRSGDSAVKITTAHYYSPQGTRIDKVGIEPDYPVSLPDTAAKKSIRLLSLEEDLQLQKAFEVLRADIIKELP